MFRTRTVAPVVTAFVAMSVAFLLTACSDRTQINPVRAESTGCAQSCASALSVIATPTFNLPLIGWRASINDRVSYVLADLGGVDMCGGSTGDDHGDCRTKVGVLVTDMRSLRDTITGSAIPPAAASDARTITNAIDTALQGCAQDDVALASSPSHVPLPGDTTSRGLQQLLDVVDRWPTP
jgi:hypothetical protein